MPSHGCFRTRSWRRHSWAASHRGSNTAARADMASIMPIGPFTRESARAKAGEKEYKSSEGHRSKQRKFPLSSPLLSSLSPQYRTQKKWALSTRMGGLRQSTRCRLCRVSGETQSEGANFAVSSNKTSPQNKHWGISSFFKVILAYRG